MLKPSFAYLPLQFGVYVRPVLRQVFRREGVDVFHGRVCLGLGPEVRFGLLVIRSARKVARPNSSRASNF